MVLVDMQVSVYRYGQINTTVPAQLVQHMIKEMKPCADVGFTLSIQVQRNTDLRFIGISFMYQFPLSQAQVFPDIFPTDCFETNHIAKGGHVIIYFRCTKAGIIVQPDRFATQIFCELHIGDPVANYKRSGYIIVRIVQVLGQHSGSRFTRRGVICRESTVYMHIAEKYRFIFQRRHDKFMHRPECLFRKRGGAKTILVGHHYQFKVQFISNFLHPGEHVRVKGQFGKRVQLVGGRGFLDQGAIPVDE